MKKKQPKEALESELAGALEHGELKKEDAGHQAVKRLSPKYEIRIQAELDPVEEETRRYREMAKEVDDRYDRRRRPR